MSVAKVIPFNDAQKVNLELEGKPIQLPIIEGSEGEKALDISKLRAETGIVTVDNGFVNTASCTSAITFLNGEKGILKYRGYTIEDLCKHSDFIEVAYLLINGNLPSETEHQIFQSKINQNSVVPEQLESIIKNYPNSAHPMTILSSAICSLSAFNPEFSKPDLSAEQKENVIAQLLGSIKVLGARINSHLQGRPDLKSKSNLPYCEDFMNMMFGDGTGSPDSEISEALDKLLILHADHEQNCSTSSVRLVGSSKASLYASISAGINALSGPLHGGANQAVLEMLEDIQSNGGQYKKFLAKAKNKSDPFKLMGFGHRVYKNFDPRAQIIKGYCDKVLAKLGIDDPLLHIAQGLEEEALKDEYFVERKLYPNVDFYSGIIYRALGIPTEMFTVMFAIGRLPGWIAQWKEMIESPDMRIGRPRQIFTGVTAKKISK